MFYSSRVEYALTCSQSLLECHQGERIVDYLIGGLEDWHSQSGELAGSPVVFPKGGSQTACVSVSVSGAC